MTSILRVNSIKTTGDKPILNSTGSILQIVSSVNTAYANSTSNSFVDISGTDELGNGSVWECNITPSSTSNKVFVQANISNNATNGYVKFFDLVRVIGGSSESILRGDTTSNSRTDCTLFLREEAQTGGDANAIMYLDSPGSTDEVTYKVQYAVQSGSSTITVNRSQDQANNAWLGNGASTITCMEIAG
mgnify:CR=1 FL=1|tara:strand:- start:1054 stop:1620 length:567 start_codon:yes stop_codon:yes gene_type:complete